jgi:hypothetical protein
VCVSGDRGIGQFRVLGMASHRLLLTHWQTNVLSVSKWSDNAVLYACTERTSDCTNVDPFVPVAASSCSHRSDKNSVRFTKS